MSTPPASQGNRSVRRGLLTAIVIAASLHVIVGAQGPGQNINVITGSNDQFIGDVFRQRQNEGNGGVSSVNPSNMIIAYNDYRTVDIADDFGVGTVAPTQGFVARLLDFFRAPWRLGRDGEPRIQLRTGAQAWIGLSFSNNGGKSWYGGLHPGRKALANVHPEFPEHDVPIPGDVDGEWLTGAQRLTQFTAASDPVMATTPNRFFLGGIAFNSPAPTGNGKSIGFVSRFTDLNNSEQGQTIHFDGTKVLLDSDQFGTGPNDKFFIDKPMVAAGPNGHVYAAFVVFDQADLSKLSSKILFFRSADYGETWQGPVTVSDPLTRNQSPWIVVNPRNEEIVYIGWRVFSAPTGKIRNAIVGRVSADGGASFIPSTPYTVMGSLRAFDQPQGNLSANPQQPPVPRSNAYPTAVIDGNGAIHVAIQEYVWPSTHKTQSQRGRPISQNTPLSEGVPRITTATSYDGGVNWTQRRAADLGTAAVLAGTQFMPVLTAAGEPGPSCGANTSLPRSRVMLMYYDARNGLVGLAPGGLGYLTGGDRRFDVRITQASACSNNGLNFSPSEQVSQYTHTTKKDPTTGEFPIVKIPSTELPAVNRAYSMFCGGNCAFTGDYIHLVPRVPYFQTASGQWKPTTAVSDPADRERLPAPVTLAIWADTRNAVTPITGPLRLAPAGPTSIDAMPWNVYGAPGTGQVSCLNPGARDQNIYAAEYTPGGLYAAAPTTFKTSSIPRSYPLYVENRTPFTKYYRLTIKPSADNTSAKASFDYTDFDAGHANFGAPLLQRASLTISPISSVAGTLVVGPGVITPVLISVEETGPPVQVGVDAQNNPIFEGGPIIAPPAGAATSVILRPSGTDPNAGETFAPAIDPTPVVSHPLGKRGEPGSLIPSGGLLVPAGTDPPWPTPFGPNPFGPNPFGPNPFGPNPFGPNPFGPNPFGPNPFGPNSGDVTVYGVTDVSYIVTNAGEQTAAFRALASVTPKPGRVYQLLLNRAVPTPVLNPTTCVASDKWQAVPISAIANPFGPNPFGPNPFGPNPFGPNPFGPNPFGPNPAPIPEEFSNSTFYVKPAGTGTAPYVADQTIDSMVFSVREWLIADALPITAGEVKVEIKATIPEFIGGGGGGYTDTPPAVGTQIPHHLAFTVQPTNASAGAPIAPAVKVAVRDTFGNTVTTGPGATTMVTIAIGTNPGPGLLSGPPLTRAAVAGVATFDNLSIDTGGVGYTLVASSGNLQPATSATFDIIERDAEGTDFWLAFPGNAFCCGTPTLSLFITGDTNTTGIVEVAGMASMFSVTAGTVTTVNIPVDAHLTTSDQVEAKGIHVTAKHDVSVYGLNHIPFTTDAYLGLPTDALGTEYIVLGYKNSNSVNASEFAVVGTVDGTKVTITPSVTTGLRVAGLPYIVDLNRGQTYQLINTNAAPADLSGTIVTSTAPIAVFGGHNCANIPPGSSACDHVIEQLPPTRAWGTNFVTMPLATRIGGDTFRFIASTDGTTVTVNGGPVIALGRGQLHEQIISGPAQITSNRPIMVAQYSNGTSFDGVTADPFMMLVPPFDQFLPSYTVTTPASGFTANFINVIAPNAAVGLVTLDGSAIPVTAFTAIGTSGFSGAQISVGLGSHNLTGPLPFGVFVYGFASYDSYGYPGGMRLAPIAP